METLFVGLLDVDEVILERDVGTIEKYIPMVAHFKLDPEQTQVLDPNFVKIFRISQLSIEYLEFCKKYLDNTVVLLKKELAKYIGVCIISVIKVPNGRLYIYYYFMLGKQGIEISIK